MRDTSIIEKLIPSIINASVALGVSAPFYFLFDSTLAWKLSAILTFYAMQVFDSHENSGFYCLGMRVFGTVWERKYTRLQRSVYSLLYTFSFSTLFFSIFFPFDLFLANMLFLQVPTILITGTTLHGFLSGGMRSKVSE